MGFKCPFCKKDFGQDKKEFDEHIKSHDEPILDLAGLAYINSTDTANKILQTELKGVDLNKNIGTETVQEQSKD